MITRILTFCLLAVSCGITQSQDAPEKVPSPDVEGWAEETLAIKKKLKDIGLAIYNFESAYSALPARYTKAPNGTPLLSWRVHLLPFLEEAELYSKFKTDEPWNSPHNKKLIQEMPDIYKTPGTKGSALLGRTHFVGIEHKHSVLAPPMNPNNVKGQVLGRCINGASNTVAVAAGAGESLEDAVPWTKPVDLRVRIETPFDDLIAAKDGVHCVMLDGSVQTLTKEKYENDKNLTFFTTRNPYLDTKTYHRVIDTRDVYHSELLRQNQSGQFSRNLPYSADRRLTGVRQADDFSGRSFSAPPTLASQSGFGVPSTNRDKLYRVINSGRASKTQTLQNEALTAEDEKTREEKLSLLKKTLEQSFDESIKVQATELEKLKTRVTKLNAVFEKRKSNRDRVIENHIDRVRLQAEGLTIPQGNLAFPVRQPDVGFRPTQVSGAASTFGGLNPARQTQSSKSSRALPRPNVNQSGGR